MKLRLPWLRESKNLQMVLLHSRSLAEMLHHLAVCLFLRRAQLAPPEKKHDRYQNTLVLNRNFSLYLHFILTNQGKRGFTQLQGENISEEFLKFNVGETNQWEEFQTSLSLQTHTHIPFLLLPSSPNIPSCRQVIPSSDPSKGSVWSLLSQHQSCPCHLGEPLCPPSQTSNKMPAPSPPNALSEARYCPAHVPLKTTVIWRLFP